MYVKHDVILHVYITVFHSEPLLLLYKWLGGVKTVTCKKLRHVDGDRGRERQSKRERERQIIICVTNVAHEHGGGWGGFDCIAINAVPQLGVHFNLQYNILKSEPLDEGHLPEENFFLPLFFILPSWAEGWCNRNQTQDRM